MPSEEWEAASLKLLEDPNGFTLWQSLIHAAENQDRIVDKSSSLSEIELLRKSFEAFLKNYPLAVNYWISFARWELKLGNCEASDAIYTKALSFLAHDLNLWTAYLRFKLDTITDGTQHLLELFETARMKIGFHFHSFDFYSLYLSFLKTYATETNKFDEKSALLLRIMMDIPLYSYAASFECVFDSMSDKRSSLEYMNKFAGESVILELKTQNQNKKHLILENLRSIARDSYVVNQYKSLQLFTFEKDLGNKCSLFDNENSSLAQFERWNSYLEFAEQKFPYNYVTQLYERCLIANSNNLQLANKYLDYIVQHRRFGFARSVLRKLISVTKGDMQIPLLLRLADLEMFLGHTILARDMIVRYVAHNPLTPNSIFNKLLDVEYLIHRNDEDRFCTLVSSIISTTKSTSFFSKILTFPLSKCAFRKFFSRYLQNDTSESLLLPQLQNCVDFSKGVKLFCDDSQLEKIPKDQT